MGRVLFSFYDGCDALELNVEDYKCEVGSDYVKDINVYSVNYMEGACIYATICDMLGV